MKLIKSALAITLTFLTFTSSISGFALSDNMVESENLLCNQECYFQGKDQVTKDFNSFGAKRKDRFDEESYVRQSGSDDCCNEEISSKRSVPEGSRVKADNKIREKKVPESSVERVKSESVRCEGCSSGASSEKLSIVSSMLDKFSKAALTLGIAAMGAYLINSSREEFCNNFMDLSIGWIKKGTLGFEEKSGSTNDDVKSEVLPEGVDKKIEDATVSALKLSVKSLSFMVTAIMCLVAGKISAWIVLA